MLGKSSLHHFLKILVRQDALKAQALARKEITKKVFTLEAPSYVSVKSVQYPEALITAESKVKQILSGSLSQDKVPHRRACLHNCNLQSKNVVTLK